MKSYRYFAASLVLLVALVSIYAVSSARHTQAELGAQMKQQGLALADAVEASSRNAIRSNALAEEMITERLFDNARLVDQLVRQPFALEAIERIRKENHLRRIELLDLDGHPWTPPPVPPMMRAMPPGMMDRMSGMPAPANPHGSMPDAGRSMMRFMWGRRWSAGPPASRSRATTPPPAIKDRVFREGSVFGVAIGATSFPGIIAVHADGSEILNVERAIGVERQIADVGRHAGVAGVTLLGPDLAVLADSTGRRPGTRLDDPTLARALHDQRPAAALVSDTRGGRVFRVVRPFTFGNSRAGLLAIDFSTAPMERAWARDLRAAVVLAVAVLLSGAAGFTLIFYTQQRHLRDVRELEARMARRERLAALGDVAAAFAHEVRNPLNAVSMALQRLRSEFAAEPADEYSRFVRLIEGEVKRLNGIVEEFIALGKPIRLESTAVDVGAMAREISEFVGPQAKDGAVEVRTVLPPSVPSIRGDRDRLRQVLLNLVVNALAAMPSGGALTVGAESSRDTVTISVADTGRGIDRETLPRIFDPYFTTRAGGLGLGLTIARRIVDAHGGAIEVESEPGRGTRFDVVLPRRFA